MISAILSTLQNNYGLFLFIGIISGILFRSYSGTAIQLSLGFVVGILIVEIIRFLVLKFL